MKQIFIFLVLLFSFARGEEFVRYQGTEFFSYDELLILSTNPVPGGELQSRMEQFFRTPIISNEAWFAGERPSRNFHPQMGEFLRVISWNIEKSFHIGDIIEVLTDQSAYRQRIRTPRIDWQGKVNNMLRQRNRLLTADVFILQEMDIGVSRSDYVDGAADLATALGLNYAYAPAQLEVDPVLLGQEDRLDSEGNVIESYDVDKEKYKGVFGSAVLSRYPIKQVICFPLKTQPYDWYTEEVMNPSTLEIGKRKATEVLFRNLSVRELKAGGGRPFFRVDLHVPGLPDDTLTVINVHLEIKCPPEGREAQMREILSYIKDIPYVVVMMGDHNSSAYDISPTDVVKVSKAVATNSSTWLSALVTLLSPQSTVLNNARRIGNHYKNYQDPFSPSIPVFLPNPVKPMFDRIAGFEFDDGGVFDCRGDRRRSMAVVNRPLGNSNERSRAKGFRHSFSVKRPIGFVGQQRLDWAFVKRKFSYEGNASENPYQFAPHFGETLVEFHCGLDQPLSDHSPLVFDMPFTEPAMGNLQRFAYQPIRYHDVWDVLDAPPDTMKFTPGELLKHIPLNKDRTALVDIGGSHRTRYISRDLGDQEGDAFQFQLRLHGKMHFANGLSLFVETQHAETSDNDPAALSENENDFGTLNANLAWEGLTSELRVGRQQLQMGEGRAFGVNNWPMVSRSWDGIQYQAERGDWVLGGFWLNEVEVKPDGLDRSKEGSTILGVRVDRGPSLRTYLLQKDEERTDLNLYAAGLSTKASLAGFDGELELAVQTGDQGDRVVDSGMAAARIGWTANLQGKPRAFVGGDYAGGDDDLRDGSIKTFDPLFGNTHEYLGIGDVIGRRNVIAAHYGLSLAPNGETGLSVSQHFFWRVEEEDAVYRANGTPYDESQSAEGTYIGSEIDLLYHFRFNPSVRFDFGSSIFYPGDALTRSDKRYTTYVQLEWTF